MDKMGHCTATITIADEPGDSYREFRCQNWPNHKGRHNWSGKQPLTLAQYLMKQEPHICSITWCQKVEPPLATALTRKDIDDLLQEMWDEVNKMEGE